MANKAKIKEKLAIYKAELEKYHKYFMEDGIVDSDEQKQLDAMLATIKEVELELNGDKDFSKGGKIGVTDETNEENIKYEYKEIVADLFVKGSGDDNAIHPNDVKQGFLGDCYFLAAIQAIAQSNPNALKKLIKDNGDGTYEVTLYVYKTFVSWNRSPVKITVDATVPVYEGSDTPLYAGKGDKELWVLLLEKAYAQYEGDYDDIEGGYANKAMGVLLGEDGDVFKTADYNEAELKTKIQAALDGKKAITASTNSKTEKKESVTVDGQKIWYSHAYNLLKLNGNKVYLQNPHGRNDVELSLSDFKKYYRKISIQD